MNMVGTVVNFRLKSQGQPQGYFAIDTHDCGRRHLQTRED